MMTSLLAAMLSTVHVNQNITIHTLIPHDTNQGWKLELFDIHEPIAQHYHKIQRQIMIVTQGKLQVTCGAQGPVVLNVGDMIHVDPGIMHSLVPLDRACFLTLDIPGFEFPQDVYYDTPTS
jgi:quercetin dioxygenase-like cupin family protein